MDYDARDNGSACGAALRLNTEPPTSRAPRQARHHTAVLAIAIDYGQTSAHRFLGSLRHHAAYKDDIVLFVSANENNRTIRTMESYRATIRRWPTQSIDRTACRITMANTCAAGSYRVCLLTDYRDVFFQRHPFERYPASADLVFANEKADLTVGSEPSNLRWARRCLGPIAMVFGLPGRLAAQSIACSGTIMGTGTALRALAIQMRQVEHELPWCRSADWAMLDQALLNVIVFRLAYEPHRLPHLAGCRTLRQEQGGGGPMNTIGSVVPVPRSSSGEVLESDGNTASAVVHQYDRHPELTPFVDKLVRSAADASPGDR